jgi:hypothetical protein
MSHTKTREYAYERHVAKRHTQWELVVRYCTPKRGKWYRNETLVHTAAAAGQTARLVQLKLEAPLMRSYMHAVRL